MSIKDIKSMIKSSSSVSQNKLYDSSIKLKTSESSSKTDDYDSVYDNISNSSNIKIQQEELKTKLDTYFYSRLIELDKKLNNLDSALNNKLITFESNLKDSTNKGLESLGIFAAILAVIIINVKIIESATSFLSAMLLMSTLTCSMITFTSLIHFYLSPNSNNQKLGLGFWLPMSFIFLLIVLAFVTHIKGVDIYRIIKNPTNQSTDVRPVFNLIQPRHSSATAN
ncbi:MAG TPA: hypothetical protein VN642_07305 [Dongiaceae bacterium]|nr:hypothetical protein [Dongiaceae bacterium]